MTLWRVVEAQAHVSTMKLVDTPDEQATLEALLDPTKPPVPPDCAHLHYLLFTPFRYPARGDSRFRRAGATPGVFYAAETAATALAEFTFWRLLFYAESPATPWPANPVEATVFSVQAHPAPVVDLTRPPLCDQGAWDHPTDYAPCHALADRARAQGALAIRSASARDPAGGLCVSLLTCAAFAAPVPGARATWAVKLGPQGQFAQARGDAAPGALDFPRDAFARDPRIAALGWER